jgi:hypothetical protein
MLRTKSGLPKHCGWNTDRHGKRRVRFRRGGFSTYVSGIPWSPEFMAQYTVALGNVAVEASGIGASRTMPGSFDDLAVRYYRSTLFRKLKASTQTVRRNVIERFRSKHGKKPIARLEREHIEDIMASMADTPQSANNLLKVLRLLLDFAVNEKMIKANAAIGVTRYRPSDVGFADWTEDEIGLFEAHYPLGSKPRLVFALCLYTAQRVTWCAWAGSMSKEIASRSCSKRRVLDC